MRCKPSRETIKKTMLGLVIFIVVIGLMRLLQGMLTRQFELGAHGKEVQLLCLAISVCLITGAVSKILLIVFRGLKGHVRVLHLCIMAFAVIVSVQIFDWLFTWFFVIIIVSRCLFIFKSKYYYYVFLGISLYFIIAYTGLKIHNSRELRVIYSYREYICNAADMSRRYIAQSKSPIIDNSIWIKDLKDFVSQNRGRFADDIRLPENITRDFCYNKILVGLDSDGIDPNAILIFSKPFEYSNLFEDIGSIKNSEKKYLWLVSHGGNVFRYIPGRDERILSEEIRKN